jgi:serine protease Do
LKEFKVYLPGNPDGTPGEYLGQDAYTGWHFVRADPSIRSKLTPITKFAAQAPRRSPALADHVWGIGLRP